MSLMFELLPFWERWCWEGGEGKHGWSLMGVFFFFFFSYHTIERGIRVRWCCWVL